MHSGLVLYAFNPQTVCMQASYCIRSGLVLYTFVLHNVHIQASYFMHSRLVLYILRLRWNEIHIPSQPNANQMPMQPIKFESPQSESNNHPIHFPKSLMKPFQNAIHVKSKSREPPHLNPYPNKFQRALNEHSYSSLVW